MRPAGSAVLAIVVATFVATVLVACAPLVARGAPVPVAIVTGSARETDFRIGQDLANFVAPDAGLALAVVATSGSADNIHRLHDDPRVDFAIVQYDVVQALRDEAAAGNAAAAALVRPLRVVTPLYTQEIYFVVRADAPMTSIHEIRGKRINVGLRGSGSALTAAALYRRMFGVPLPPGNATYLADDLALAALTIDRTVDVVMVVAGQPAKLFADMQPQAREFIRLLALDPRRPASREALKVYFPATIRAGRGTAWLAADVPTLSVMSFLVTSEARAATLAPHLGDFARSLCGHLAALRADGHPKWREVPLGEQFGERWVYDPASATAFDQCAVRSRVATGDR